MNIAKRLRSNFCSDVFFIPIFLALGILGALIVIYSTTWGPWAKADSAEYIEAAENLIQGRGAVLLSPTGEFQSLNIRPPLYSIILPGAGHFDMDILVAARWINVILYCSFLVITGVSLRSIVEDPWVPVLVLLLILTYPIFTLNFSGVMAEPVFFICGFSSIVLLIRYLCEEKIFLLFFSTILAGLSLLARFSGFTFLGTALLGLILLGRRSYQRRAIEVISYAVLGFFLFIIWIFSVYRAGRTPGEYALQTKVSWDMLEPLRASLIDIFWDGFQLKFLFPSPTYLAKVFILFLLFSTFAFILVGLILKVVKTREGSLSTFRQLKWVNLGVLFLILIIIYMIFLVVTHVVVKNPKPAIYERILSPILFGMIISCLSLTYPSLQSLGFRRAARIPIFLVTFLLIVPNTLLSYRLIQRLHLDGLGYTGRDWQAFEVINELSKLPDEIPLISNDIEAIKFFLGRTAFNLSELINNAPVETFDRYGEDERDPIQMIFRREGAALILFYDKFWKFQDLYGWEAKNRVEKLTRGLKLYFEGQDGAIYFFPTHQERTGSIRMN
jgi:hypothetical protein